MEEVAAGAAASSRSDVKNSTPSVFLFPRMFDIFLLKQHTMRPCYTTHGRENSTRRVRKKDERGRFQRS